MVRNIDEELNLVVGEINCALPNFILSTFNIRKPSTIILSLYIEHTFCVLVFEENVPLQF